MPVGRVDHSTTAVLLYNRQADNAVECLEARGLTGSVEFDLCQKVEGPSDINSLEYRLLSAKASKFHLCQRLFLVFVDGAQKQHYVSTIH